MRVRAGDAVRDAEIWPVVAARIAPEVMVKAIASYGVLDARHDVSPSPGLGAAARRNAGADRARAAADDRGRRCAELLATRPDVLARCAGRVCSRRNPEKWRGSIPGGHTPARGDRRGFHRALFPRTLLLKGARTLVGTRRALSYNTPAIRHGTGGMGDVLTGVCAALAGQGLASTTPRGSAHGCADARQSWRFFPGGIRESLAATHVIARLGEAWQNLRAGCW